MNINPRGKYILVKPDLPTSKVSEHGIASPSNTEQEQKAYGEVIAVGPEIKDVKKGDKVIFGAYAGELIIDEVKGKRVEYRLVHDEDIVAFLK